ncbi:alpha/beta fold hydrolase [Rhizobium halophytocola]|uniref:Pimeloyl-ACP methyl ester carboxylesterase n=1 Tax=Rhizobium halophytocola TaxID=735519 RepID=A0ABS4DVF6_9HYPH|nr:alpha/beta hydrolase [Rhizobium halophytocola]MBP1849670.1 pimeloyl-ACP methyl ester carboxylesterase [Rhizobium halophytocola]
MPQFVPRPLIRYRRSPGRNLAATLLLVGLSLAAFAGAGRADAASPDGERIDVGDITLNSVLLEPAGKPQLPPVVFLHGASTSLLDPMFSFRQALEGKARLLFVDRPGHGKSGAGPAKYILPDAQADAIALLMERRGITRAIIVGHSFGGAITAELAVRHPDKVAGLVFLSPAVYPWKGGVDWYYNAASVPIAGWIFSTLIAPPIGFFALDTAAKAVFAPNTMPADYVQKTKASQALNPVSFHRNAEEIAALNDWAKTASPLYRNIRAPTVVITGDTDDIVSPQIHSEQLARDIPGASLFVVHNLGHKSDYVARDLAVAAIETVAGKHPDLDAIRRAVEERIAGDGKP